MEVKDATEFAGEDFARIFKLLPPYESLYNYPVVGHDVHAFYESEGLMLDEELGLPADHIGVELLFMSYLVENERLDSEKRFLEGHLLRWSPSYLDMVERTAKSQFYKDIAMLTKGFITSDYERLLE